MSEDFWKRCVAADCVVMPVRAYRVYGRDGNLHENHFLGIKFTPIPVDNEVAGPDYYCDFEVYGNAAIYDTPEDALLAHENKK